jgi:NADH:ubiquinone oxidoreductase subunit 2 (subunit N)
MITAIPLFLSAVALPLLGRWWRYLALVSLVASLPLLDSTFSSVLVAVLFSTLLHVKDEGTGVQTLLIGVASLFLLKAETLIEFIIGFEALSILSFILLAKLQNREEAEASVSLFIMGAVASGVIFLGTALYSLGGGDVMNIVSVPSDISYFGLATIFLGVFYKFSLLPMHNWAVTTYTKGNFIHIAIISGVVKSVVVLATFMSFQPVLGEFTNLFIFIAIASMLFGNFSALFQKRVSKILAYSSIAQAGYLLLPFVAVESSFSSSAIEYLAIAYILMQSATFLLLDIAKANNLEDLKGLGERNPLVALFFTVQLFSLGGVPLLAGFMSKAVAFYSLTEAGLWWLSLIAFLNSALSVGYYSWIVKFIYFDKSDKNGRVEITLLETFSQTILLLGTILLGIFAGFVFEG